MNPRIPLLILAGSDLVPGPLPPTPFQGQMLSGFKGKLELPSGKTLAAELVDRYRASDRFQEPVLFGPKSVYEGLVDCEIVDVSGNLAKTMERVRDCARTRWPADTPVAVSASDILPTPAEIRDLLETSYDPHPDCKFWWQVIPAEPEALGPSAWKPHYEVRPARNEEPQAMFPGHLVIFHPGAVRLDLLIRLMELVYRYRNRPHRKRAFPMLVRGIGTLAAQDGRNLLRAQLPILTATIPWHILRAYAQFRRKTLTIAELESRLAKVLLHRQYRSQRGAFIIAQTQILSFAKDIDSQSELDAVYASMS